MYKRIVVTGSLAYDHIMSMPGSFGDHIMPDKIHILNVSFIMKTFRREFGGTGGNIAYSLALLGTPALLVSAAGYDFQDYFKHLKKLKILDTSGVRIVKTIQTAQGFVTTDKNDNQIWGFYEGAMKKTKKIAIGKFLKSGDFAVIAPNDPKGTIRFVRECVQKKIPYLFDPAFNIPHFSKKELEFCIKYALIVVGNDYEIELLKRRLGRKNFFKEDQILITTLGEKGSIINKGNDVFNIPAVKPQNTSDPTGAGDAFRAGFLAGFVKDFPLEICGRMGSLSAVYTVEKYGTQTHKFSISQFKSRFRKNFNTELKLI